MNGALLRRFTLGLLLLTLCVSEVSPQGFTGCPPCWRDASVMAGHGADPGDTRRLINVRIDSTFGNQTPANVWNATCAGTQTAGCSNVTGPSAIKMWDDVSTYYKLRLVQDSQGADDATDIQITQDSSWDSKKGCSYSTQTGQRVPDPERPGATLLQISSRVIHLPPGSQNWSQEQLACILGHEMGHVLGLGDVKKGCSTSIMNQNHSGGRGCSTGCPRSQVSNGDVQSVNQQAGNRAGCNKGSKPVSRIVDGGYEDPNPYRYYPTCYYYYEAVDLWYCRWIMSDGTCHPEFPPEYLGTIYVLRDVRCY